jgi:hypothetical protein
MKTRYVVLALALVASASDAAIIATAETEDPLASMLFHDEKGDCIGNARRAEFAKIGSASIYGCWVVRSGGYISISWLDGDYDRVPLSVLKHDGV